MINIDEEALECFILAFSINSNDSFTLLNIGLAYKEADRIAESVSLAYVAFIFLNFYWIIALEKVLVNESGKSDAVSLKYVNEAKEILAQIHTDVGTRLKIGGHLEQAIEKYLHASTIKPNYSPSYYNIGVVYSETGRFDEALKYYHLALEHNSYYVEAYCNIGVIFKNTNKLEDAILYYGKALQINPNFLIAKSNMAIALTDYGTKLKNEGKLKVSIDSSLTPSRKVSLDTSERCTTIRIILMRATTWVWPMARSGNLSERSCIMSLPYTSIHYVVRRIIIWE